MSLKVENISKEYQHKTVLTKVNLTFEPKTIYGLLGRNGAGKSTLLNIINNRIFSSSGKVTLDHSDVAENEKSLNKIYLMSEENLFPGHLKIKELFSMSEAFYGDFDWKFADRLTNAFDLDASLKFRKLSTGYRTIAKIIIALCVPCEYVFLDEPVLGLDANHRDLFYSFLLESYADQPRTFVISTHLIEEIANLLEYIVFIDHGKVLLTDSTENILEKGKVISGPKAAVETFTRDLSILNQENLGGLVNVYVSAELPPEIPSELTVSPMDLQTYFVQTTRKKGA